MSSAETQFLAEMAFGNTATTTEAVVTTFSNGWVRVCVQPTGDELGEVADTGLTLGQAIQLRDFLNRHIDGLALQQIGSLAQRASDDPAQLASVEETVCRSPAWGGLANFGQAPGCGTIGTHTCKGTGIKLMVSCGGMVEGQPFKCSRCANRN